MIIMPQTVYFTAKDHGRYGIGFTDPQDSADAALDLVLDGDEPERLRIFRVDFCPDTNLPERIEDVTEETINARNDWLASRGVRLVDVA